MAAYVEVYIRKCFKFRLRAVEQGLPKPTQFFLSHLTGKPVQRASISRWIREVMAMSGIDVSTFRPGSTRGATASMATRQGATPDQILRHGDWSNLGMYQRFYDRDIGVPVGRLVLQSSQCESLYTMFLYFLTVIFVRYLFEIGCSLWLWM